MVHPYRVRLIVCLAGLMAGFGPANARQDEPQSPALFLPGGILGSQVGARWAVSKRNPAFGRLSCQASRNAAPVFDEVCFFRTTARVAGANVHDGFIVRRGDRLVLIGTGIAIKDPDDPLAEAVMRDLESRIHATYQHTGADVLFVNLPPKRLSTDEMAGYSQTAPVLLVELEPKGDELALLYGYLAPVNAFSAMTAE